MAWDITKGPNHFCPENCHHMAIQITNNSYVTGFKTYDVKYTMTCVHEKACKMWFEKKEVVLGTKNE